MKNLKVRIFDDSTTQLKINEFLKDKDVEYVVNMPGYNMLDDGYAKGQIYIFYKEEEE